MQTSTFALSVVDGCGSHLVSLCQVQAVTGTDLLCELPPILTLGLCDTKVSKALLRSSGIVACTDRLMENPENL